MSRTVEGGLKCMVSGPLAMWHGLRMNRAQSRAMDTIHSHTGFTAPLLIVGHRIWEASELIWGTSSPHTLKQYFEHDCGSEDL